MRPDTRKKYRCLHCRVIVILSRERAYQSYWCRSCRRIAGADITEADRLAIAREQPQAMLDRGPDTEIDDRGPGG